MKDLIDTSEYRGLEFDWIGVDADGHVALCFEARARITKDDL